VTIVEDELVAELLRLRLREVHLELDRALLRSVREADRDGLLLAAAVRRGVARIASGVAAAGGEREDDRSEHHAAENRPPPPLPDGATAACHRVGMRI